MATTEHTINDALAQVLETTRRAWRSTDIVRSENTGMLRGSNKRPDIKVLPIAPDWEIDLPAGARRSECSGITVIECGSKVCDRVSEDETKLWAERLAIELDRMVPGFWVSLNAKRIAFLRNLPGTSLEISNVMSGPIYLQVRR